MKDTTQSQATAIFNYLYGTFNTITGLEASKMFGCAKLPNRIMDIERDFKVTVDRERITVKTKFGDKRVMKYWIAS